MASVPEPAAVGQPAPLFSLTSVQGDPVELAAYRGHRNVLVWFSRGFTCLFCRVYMDGMREGYELLRAAESAIPTSASSRSMGSATGAPSRRPARRW